MSGQAIVVLIIAGAVVAIVGEIIQRASHDQARILQGLALVLGFLGVALMVVGVAGALMNPDELQQGGTP